MYDSGDNDNNLLDYQNDMYDDTKHLRRQTELVAKDNALFKFCTSLPKNLVFDAGFGLLYKESNKPVLSDNRFNYCYCPCSSTMSKWQRQFNVQPIICSKNEKCTPVGLLDHLRSHSDVYHRAVKIYLEILYAKMLEWTKEGRKASRGIEWENGIEWEKYVWSKFE